MSSKWWRFEVLLPLQFNDGREVPAEWLAPFELLVKGATGSWSARAFSQHWRTSRQKVGGDKRSVSGLDEHAGNGLRPYPGLRLRKRYVSSLN